MADTPKAERTLFKGLAINDKNRLTFYGENVVTHLSLSWWQRIAAGLLLLAAVASPVVAFLADRDKICANTGNPRIFFCSKPVEKVDTERPLIAYSVFFANQSSGISKAQQEALRSFLLPLSKCGKISGKILGNASSAKFATESDKKNISLAADRTNAVSLVARELGMELQVILPSEKISSGPKLQDVDSLGDRLPAWEDFNRRADIIVTSFGSCTSSGSSTEATE